MGKRFKSFRNTIWEKGKINDNEIIPELDFFLVTPEPHEEFNNIDDFFESIFGEEANKKDELVYDPEYYDPYLDLAFESSPEEVIYESENHWMFFIKNIAIGSLDIVISTRIDLNSFGQFLPGFLMGVISAIGNVFTHITDYHLKFTSLIYTDVFTDIYSLSGQLTNNYLFSPNLSPSNDQKEGEAPYIW